MSAPIRLGLMICVLKVLLNTVCTPHHSHTYLAEALEANEPRRLIGLQGIRGGAEASPFYCLIGRLRALPRFGFLPDNAVFRSLVLIQVAQSVG